MLWNSSTYRYSVYLYGTYLYLTYFWSTSHLFPCVPIFPHPPILQSVMFSLVIIYKLTITTIIISFTSCDATILAVDSRSLSTISARMDITTTSSTGISTMSQRSIPRTSRAFIYQLSSPPASNTLMWGKCLTLACSNSRSRVSCSLIKLINNYNYNNNVEHVDVWQADDNRRYPMRLPRWWHRGHRPCHLRVRRDIVTPIQSACTAFSVEHVKMWQGGRQQTASTTLMTPGTSIMSPLSTLRYWSLPMHFLHIDDRPSTSLNAWTRECMNDRVSDPVSVWPCDSVTEWVGECVTYRHHCHHQHHRQQHTVKRW